VLFSQAPYHDHTDPLDRVLGYVAFRKALLQGGVPEFTCLVDTMVRETYEAVPAIRDACDRSISGHAETKGEITMRKNFAINYASRDGVMQPPGAFQ